MFTVAASQCFPELWLLRLQTAMRQLRQLGTSAAFGDGSQNAASTNAHDVAEHAGQLDVDGLQQASDAVDDAIAILLQMHPQPFQGTRFAHRRGWNKAACQSSMLQKLSNAGAVDAVGLVSGHGSHLSRVDQGQMKPVA